MLIFQIYTFYSPSPFHRNPMEMLNCLLFFYLTIAMFCVSLCVRFSSLREDLFLSVCEDNDSNVKNKSVKPTDVLN